LWPPLIFQELQTDAEGTCKWRTAYNAHWSCANVPSLRASSMWMMEHKTLQRLHCHLTSDFSTRPLAHTHTQRSHTCCFARFSVLTVVRLKVAIFWNITTCRLSVIYQYFGRPLVKHVPPEPDYTTSHSTKQYTLSGFQKNVHIQWLSYYCYMYSWL
jgi:hypothetical protein